MNKLTFIILALFNISVFAFQTRASEKLSIARIGVDEGLPHTDVTSVCQDKRGFIWIGTLGGLCRYDGVELKIISASEDGLPSSRINCLGIDCNDYLYVGTEDSWICVMNAETLEVLHRIRLSSGMVNEICCSSSGGVWFFSDNGISSLNLVENSYQIKSWSIDHPILGGCEIRESDGLFLATAYGLGVFRDGILSYETRSGYTNSITPYDDGKYIVSTQTGTYLYSPKTHSYDRIDDSDAIISSELHDGTIWIGTLNDGLKTYDPRSGTSRSLGLPAREIRSLFPDKSGVVWIGTIGQGCFFSSINSRKFNYISMDGDEDSSIASLYADKECRLWISSRGRQSYCKKGDALVKIDKGSFGFGSDAQISTFWEDSEGNLWVGAWSEGYRIIPRDEVWKAAAGKPFMTTGSGSFNASIFKFIPDGETIWLSTNAGLYEIDAISHLTRRRYTYNKDDQSSLPADFCTDVLVCGDTLWVGTSKGLAIIIGEQVRRIPSERLGGDFISALHRDADGTVWVCSLGGSVRRVQAFEDGLPLFQNIEIPHGYLRSREYESIQEDRDGNLWIGGPGLIRLNPKTGTVRRFSKEDGLQGNVFKIWASTSYPDGRLAFGGTSGLNIFNPSQIHDSESVPDVFITGININGADREDIGKLTFKENNITFRFAALDYSSPKNNLYKYKLEGADNEWHETDGAHARATYLNLLPGRYRFLVKAAGSNGIWCQKPTEYDFRIKPPFYASLFARLLYITVFALVTFFIIRSRRKRRRHQYDLEIERKLRLDEQRRNENELKFHTDFLHEIKTPLTLIKTPVGELLENPNLGKNTQSRLRLVLQSANILQKHIDEITDLRKFDNGNVKLRISESDFAAFVKETSILFQPVAESQSIRFSITAPDSPVVLFFDKDQMEKVVINLLSNAIKYSPKTGGLIKITVDSDDNVAKLLVSNIGIGILPEDIDGIFGRFRRGSNNIRGGMGIGLSISKHIVELHGGNMQVSSVPGGETIFTVTIPLGRSLFSDSQICSDETDAENQNSYDALAEFESLSAARHSTDKLSNVLVIDDNGPLRGYFLELLSSLYNVTTAADGFSGYERAIADQPDLVISDIMMPGMNGLELCSRLKKNPDTSHIPIILISARDLPVHKMEGYSLLADDYITKPFRADMLLARIDNLIRQREVMKKAFRESVKLAPSEVTATSSDAKFMARCIEVIEAHISEHGYGVNELCNELGISRPQLYKKIKSITGLSPVHFVREIRLKRAAQLLSGNHDLSVGEVADAVGFIDKSYFTKLFVAEFGVLPKDYKR